MKKFLFALWVVGTVLTACCCSEQQQKTTTRSTAAERLPSENK